MKTPKMSKRYFTQNMPVQFLLHNSLVLYLYHRFENLTGTKNKRINDFGASFFLGSSPNSKHKKGGPPYGKMAQRLVEFLSLKNRDI